MAARSASTPAMVAADDSGGNRSAVRRASARKSCASSTSAVETTRPSLMPMRYSCAASWTVVAIRWTTGASSAGAPCGTPCWGAAARAIWVASAMRIILKSFERRSQKLERSNPFC